MFLLVLQEADKIKEAKPAEEEKIDVNLSKLTKREKLKLLGEESPELLELAEDFKGKLLSNGKIWTFKIKFTFILQYK